MFKWLLKFKKTPLIVGGAGALAGFEIFRQGHVSADFKASDHNGVTVSETLSRPRASLPSDEDLELKGLVVFFRHGARTPLRPLVGIEEVCYDQLFFDGVVPHAEVPVHVQSLDGSERPSSGMQARYQKRKFSGGMEAGKLTKLGKEQVYLLGRRLREKYGEELNFIPSEFTAEDVYLRSTNIQRCVESMQAALAGLYGINTFTESDPAIVEVATDSAEKLYPNSGACESLRKMSRQVPLEMEEFEDYVDVVKKIQSITGDDSSVGRFDIMQHRDHMVARKTHGLHVPKWMLDMEEEIEKSAVKCILQYVKGPVGDHHLVLMLSCGRILDMVEKNLNTVSKQLPSAKKLYLYSCHDTTLIPLLVSLGCYDDKWPNYAADIIFEFYEDKNSKNWVKVLYEGKKQPCNPRYKTLMLHPAFDFLCALIHISNLQPLCDAKALCVGCLQIS